MKKLKKLFLSVLMVISLVGGVFVLEAHALNTTVNSNVRIYDYAISNDARGQINTGARIEVLSGRHITNSRSHVRLRSANNGWAQNSQWWINYLAINW